MNPLPHNPLPSELKLHFLYDSANDDWVRADITLDCYQPISGRLIDSVVITTCLRHSTNFSSQSSKVQ